jgi:hypothetical protein
MKDAHNPEKIKMREIEKQRPHHGDATLATTTL